MVATLRWLGRRAARSSLDRLLSIFTRVDAGEGLGAVLLAADIFCVLASYYLLKTAREALILSERSAEVKSYAAGAQAVILLGLVPLYGAVASRVGRTRLVNGVLLFFVSHLAIFYVLASHGHSIAVPFFLWVGVFNLMVVAQFWAFANDLYTLERGKRLFPVIGVGGSLGAVFGAYVAKVSLTAHMQPTTLFTLAGIGLLLCVLLNHCVARNFCRWQTPSAPSAEGRPLGRAGAYRLVLTDRYLRLIAAMVIVVNTVNSIGEYVLGGLVKADALQTIASGASGGLSQGQLVGLFYANFFAWVNLGGLAIQLFVVSRVLGRIGVAGALFILPCIAFGGYALFAFLPVLGAVRFGKILENSTDYSLQNTARHALFLSTSREAKFKAKQAIDALCWRLGDVLHTAIVFTGVTWLAFGIRQFALVNELFVFLWILVVMGIYREYKRRTAVPTEQVATEAA